MTVFPNIDPVAIRLGPVAVHWYGLMYLVAFGVFLLLARQRLRHPPFNRLQGPASWNTDQIGDMLLLGVLGTVVGGRLGYVLFYKPDFYLAHPLQVFAVWEGGMSFHGGLLGVIASQYWFARSRGKPFWQVMDLVAPCVPLGLAAGRIGNFINGELWGRAASPSLPWAIVFPQSGSLVPRHPSQLYEAVLEGLVLFVVLWLYARRERPQGRVAALFLIGYGLLRFAVEFFREPDAFLGLGALGLSRGQWLSLPLVLAGTVLWIWAGRHRQSAPALA